MTERELFREEIWNMAMLDEANIGAIKSFGRILAGKKAIGRIGALQKARLLKGPLADVGKSVLDKAKNVIS